MKKWQMETRCTHAGREIEPGSRSIVPAISPGTTFERDVQGNYPGGHQYSRGSNPTRARLEAALAELENASEAIAFASGMAAISAVFQVLRPGDHAIVCADAYHGTLRYVREWIAPRGIDVDFVDTADTAAVRASMRKSTRLLWIESPSNPLLKISDLAALAELASENDCLTACDATLATPLLQATLDFGIDIVVHSSTKYLGGHGDLLGGVACTRNADIGTRLRKYQVEAGGVPSAFDAWLLLRSLPTLPLRIRQQSETALALAEWLEQQPWVEKVHYPLLASHPHRALAQRTLSAGGGLLSIEVVGNERFALALAASTQLFTQATSLGGFESLIEHRASVEGDLRKSPDNLLRLAIGLEHLEDLKIDLLQARETADDRS